MKIAIFHLQLFGINTYIVWDDKSRECAVIDPGMINEEEENSLSEFIEKHKLTVTHLINTHMHVDHSIGNRYVSERYNVVTEASPDDAFLGENLVGQLRSFGIGIPVGNVTIATPLEDHDIINIGEEKLEVLAVPGHSPGGLALYDSKDGFVITGDSLFERSIGRTDLPGGDHATLIAAVKNKLLSLPGSTVVYPGHGDPTTIQDEKNYNPFLK